VSAAQFDQAAPDIVAAVQSGATIEEAAISVGVAVATVRRWLGTGRKGRERYAEFARAVDGARDERKKAERELTDGPLTAEEAELLIAKAARRGSVPALRLWYERLAADDAGRRGQDARKQLADVFGGG
jgi:hypothetical protein